MSATPIIFLVVAALTLAAAFLVVTVRNLIHAALWLVAALFGVATVAMVYVAGCEAYGRRVGLLGAAFAASTVLSVQLSHFYVSDTMLGFLVALILVLALRQSAKPSFGLFVAVPVVAGVALATKFSGLFILVPLAVTVYWGLKVLQLGSERPIGRRNLAARFGLELFGGILIIATVFILLNPSALRSPSEYWFLDFGDSNWWNAWNFPAGNLRLLWNLLLSEGAVRPLWAIASMPSIRLINPLSLLAWGMGPPLLIVSLLGIALAMRHRTKAGWLLLSYVLAAYLMVANSHVQSFGMCTRWCPR